MTSQKSSGKTVGETPGQTRTRASDTRDRILDVALDLFTSKGYAETSLREIAEELGFSKAALYYHFKSKEDILVALHLRVHRLGQELRPLLEQTGGGDEAWRQIVDGLISVALKNRRLLELHVRNKEAIEKLHTGDGATKHGDVPFDMDEQIIGFLNDSSVPLEARVRRTASVASVIGVLLTGNAFSEASNADLEKALRSVVADVLRSHPG